MRDVDVDRSGDAVSGAVGGAAGGAVGGPRPPNANAANGFAAGFVDCSGGEAECNVVASDVVVAAICAGAVTRAAEDDGGNIAA